MREGRKKNESISALDVFLQPSEEGEEIAIPPPPAAPTTGPKAVLRGAVWKSKILPVCSSNTPEYPCELSLLTASSDINLFMILLLIFALNMLGHTILASSLEDSVVVIKQTTNSSLILLEKIFSPR